MYCGQCGLKFLSVERVRVQPTLRDIELRHVHGRCPVARTAFCSIWRMSVSCPACGGSSSVEGLIVEEVYRLSRCGSCKTEFFVREGEQSATEGRESAYWEDYKFDVYADSAVLREFEGRYEKVLQLAETVVGPIKSVLDIGCGIGNFVAFASSRGIRAVGSDVDLTAVEAGRARGLEILTDVDVEDRIADGSMDAVTMWDVIEHLLDPYEGLTAAVRKVRPGGALLFETPDAAFPVRRAVLGIRSLSRGKLDFTDPFYYLEHRTYFTEAGMRALLERCGAELVSVQRMQSPRQKMARLFAAEGSNGATMKRVLAKAWPVLESATRAAHMGNKLIVIGRRLS